MVEQTIETIEKRTLFYLGPPFSFSHEAGEKYFKDEFSLASADTIDEIIDLVLDNERNVGILPFFNRYESHIRETQEKFWTTEIIVKAVVKHRIELYLLASPGVKIDDIQYVFSNIHVYKQCDSYLSKFLPNAKFEPIVSTAKAAEEIKGNPLAAAICSREAGEKYGLNILAEQIQNKNNYTLFFLIEKNGKDRDKMNEAYSLFCIKDDISLNKKKVIFDIAQKHRLDLTQMWTFFHQKEKHHLLYCELVGRVYDLDAVNFKAELEKIFREVKLVGSYNESITDILQD